MDEQEYLDTYACPLVRLVCTQAFPTEAWPVQRAILDALLRHKHRGGKVPPAGELQEWLLHARHVVATAHRCAPEAPPDVVALLVTLTLTPLHHWAAKEGPAEPATSPQLRLLQNLGVEILDKATLSKAEASVLIDQAKGRRLSTPSPVEAPQCEVPWCEERIGQAQAERSRREIPEAPLLCEGHFEAYPKLRCSECGSLLDPPVHRYCVERVFTPLCFAHQRAHGILSTRRSSRQSG